MNRGIVDRCPRRPRGLTLVKSGRVVIGGSLPAVRIAGRDARLIRVVAAFDCIKRRRVDTAKVHQISWGDAGGELMHQRSWGAALGYIIHWVRAMPPFAY